MFRRNSVEIRCVGRNLLIFNELSKLTPEKSEYRCERKIFFVKTTKVPQSPSKHHLDLITGVLAFVRFRAWRLWRV